MVQLLEMLAVYLHEMGVYYCLRWEVFCSKGRKLHNCVRWEMYSCLRWDLCGYVGVEVYNFVR